MPHLAGEERRMGKRVTAIVLALALAETAVAAQSLPAAGPIGRSAEALAKTALTTSRDRHTRQRSCAHGGPMTKKELAAFIVGGALAGYAWLLISDVHDPEAALGLPMGAFGGLGVAAAHADMCHQELVGNLGR
jgi:hypothetical protein